MSIIDDVLAMIGVKSGEPTPAEVRDESQRDLEAERGSARKARARAESIRDNEQAVLANDERAVNAAAKKLEALAYDRADDETIDDAKADLERAKLRADGSRRRLNDADAVLDQVNEILVNLNSEIARVEAERVRAKVLEEASPERLRKDCDEDEATALRAYEEMMSALARIAHRFDTANSAAVDAGLPPLDASHAFGGLLTRLAADDPRHAVRFLRDPAQFRSALKSPANNGMFNAHKSTDLGGFISILMEPPSAYSSDATACEDLAVFLSKRTWREADEAVKAVQNERKRIAFESPEAVAKRAAEATQRQLDSLRHHMEAESDAAPVGDGVSVW